MRYAYMFLMVLCLAAMILLPSGVQWLTEQDGWEFMTLADVWWHWSTLFSVLLAEATLLFLAFLFGERIDKH